MVLGEVYKTDDEEVLDMSAPGSPQMKETVAVYIELTEKEAAHMS